MATAARNKKSARRRQLEAAINYPIDWLEERSGLVGALRYFLFRKVPADTNWFQTLGSATLTAFLIQALTGVVLAALVPQREQRLAERPACQADAGGKPPPEDGWQPRSVRAARFLA